jgi:hypothetical protein
MPKRTGILEHSVRDTPACRYISLQNAAECWSSKVGAVNVSWWWRYEKADGTVIKAAGRDGSPGKGKDKAARLPYEEFPSQSDAESWIGQSWHDLLKLGVDRVTLLEGERVEYGPMSLHPTE